MKNLIISLKLFFSLSILTGIIYPLLVTFYASQFIPMKSNGSLIYRDEKIIASRLMGQKFQSEKYFWSRPSAVDYNSASSGASNYASTSQDLQKLYQERRSHLITANKGDRDNAVIPQDLLFASGSGLDPHISPEAALFQIERIATQRKLNTDLVRKLVNKYTEARQFGILGEPRVNVILLNLALDTELK